MSFQTPHIWCFFVLRCLIYKVHAPTAEHVIDYHVARELSTPFLHFFGFSQKYFGDKSGKRCYTILHRFTVLIPHYYYEEFTYERMDPCPFRRGIRARAPVAYPALAADKAPARL